MKQQSLMQFLKVVPTATNQNQNQQIRRNTHRPAAHEDVTTLGTLSYKLFLYTGDAFPLSTKQQQQHAQQRVLPDTQIIQTLDDWSAVCALVYKYVFVCSTMHTKDVCKLISKTLETKCVQLAHTTHHTLPTHTTDSPLPLVAYAFLIKHFGTHPKAILKIIARSASNSPYRDSVSVLHTPELYSASVASDIVQQPHLLCRWFGLDFEIINKVAFENDWWSHCSRNQIHTYMYNDLTHSSDTCMFWGNGRGIMKAKRDLLSGEDESMQHKFQKQLRTCYDSYQQQTHPNTTTTNTTRANGRLLHETFYTTPELADAEHRICQMNHLYDDASYEPGFGTSIRVENRCRIRLDKTQQSTIETFVSPENHCLILQGGAGTGKTQVGVCAALEYNVQRGIPVTWCAPTHEATLNAKRRLQSYCQTSTVCFSTLHSFIGKMEALHNRLCSALKEKTPSPAAIYHLWQDTKDEDDATPRVLVIDECSMIPSVLLATVIRYIQQFRIQKVLLLGDRHQLEPVDAGKPFADLQDMYAKHPHQKHLPKVITLHKNYRSEGLGIIELLQNVIDTDFMWTFEHDVQDNPDVSFFPTTDDEHTLTTMVSVLSNLHAAGSKPATFLRMHPEDTTTTTTTTTTTSTSFHIITPNNMHVLPYANLVRKTVYQQDIPHDTLAPNDIVRFDTNRKNYHNGTLGKVVYVKRDSHILIQLQEEHPSEKENEKEHETENETRFEAGVLKLLRCDEYLQEVYRDKGIRTPFALWKDEYIRHAKHMKHPFFYTIARDAYNCCCNAIHTQSTTTLAKQMQSIYWESVDAAKTDVFVVCKNVVCLPHNQRECKLSYASTIHKAQGGEADYIICVMPPSMRYSVNRNLAYTAFSRARKHLYLVGSPSFFQKCNNNAPKRITLLPHMI